MHAETMLPSPQRGRGAVTDAGLKQRMRPMTIFAFPEAMRRSPPRISGASLPSRAQPPSGGGRERRNRGEMLPGKELRRPISAAWAAGLGDRRRGNQRDHRLAGADVACSSLSSPARRYREVALDLGGCLALRWRQAEAGGLNALPQLSRGPHGVPRPRLRLPRTSRQRQLAGDQLVEGEALPGQAGRAEL